MPIPENTSPAPDQEAGWRARAKKYWKYWVPILTAVIVVPSVTWGRDWVRDKFWPEPHLVAVVTIPSPGEICSGGEGWVFEKDPQQLPGLPANRDLNAWAADNGGVPASGNFIKVTLQGQNGHNVLVHEIEVEVRSRTEPPHGTYPLLSGGCGGYLPYRFSLNLDARPVSVTAQSDEGWLGDVPGGVPRLVELPHKITGSEPEVWHLAALTETCTCEWTATLKWTSDDGKAGSTPITDNGKPFRVAAKTRATVADFVDKRAG